MRPFVGEQRLPVLKRLLKSTRFWRVWTAFDVVERCLIRCDQTGARAAFNRHIADGHAAFHRQIADRFPAIFDDVPSPTTGAGLTNHGQRDVFGGHTRLQFASDLHLHVFGLLLDQRLRGKHVLHLRGADAVGQCAKRTVGRGVAVTTDHSHARQSPALLRANNVHNALTHVRHRIVMHTKLLGVGVQRLHLNARLFGHLRRVIATFCGRHVVVRHSNGFLWRTHLAARHAQAFKRLRAGHFVDEVTVNIQKAGAIVGFMRNMGIPDLIIERFGGHRSSPFCLDS
mmetsp:Transcript_2512/g.4263  ORF Transcript_2512/g.4263 Transcript_2512/m.4263 type:complete len:285 (-) Transcript_2512:134-988(-)